MWNKRRIIKEFETNESAIRWCRDNGILPKKKTCPRHRSSMKYNGKKGLGSFRCNKRDHNFTTSITKRTLFEHTKLPLNKVFSIMYSFCEDESYERCTNEAFVPGVEGLSCQTICDWYQIYRQIVVDDFLIRQENRGKIGGPGKTVQINEHKFGEDRRSEAHWVLGMIEAGAEDFRLAVCPENLRDVETLMPIIKHHVAEGSKISTNVWTDCKLAEYGFQHIMSEDGILSQQIESRWRPIVNWVWTKHVAPDKFADALVEYQWRNECHKNKVDTFDNLLNAIRLKFPIWLVELKYSKALLIRILQ